MEITSIKNEKIKRILKIRRHGHDDDDRLFGVEGAREIRCALKGGYVPAEAYFSPECFSAQAKEVFSSFEHRPEVQYYSVAKSVFEKIAMRERTDGLYVLFRSRAATLLDLEQKERALYLVLEGLEKPGNLGAILRTADCVGVDAVIVTAKRVDIFNPNLIRASLGTIFLLPVVVAGVEEVAAHLKSRNMRMICADPAAEKSHFDVRLDGPLALILGSEADGLSDYWLKHADEKLCIPMKGTVDSLNVSVAAAVFMYEAVRQRIGR